MRIQRRVTYSTAGFLMPVHMRYFWLCRGLAPSTSQKYEIGIKRGENLAAHFNSYKHGVLFMEHRQTV